MESNAIINGIYQNTLKKFYEATKNINICQGENTIYYLNNQLINIIELLKKCQNGVISIDSIKLLNDISFNDFLRDKYIIESVSSNHIEINDNNIFIMKSPKFLYDDQSYFRIIERDGRYIAIRYHEGNIKGREISLAELNSFVSLNKALNDSEHICYSAKQFIYDITILYSGQIYASENYFTLYKTIDNILKLYVTDKRYSANGFFQNIYYTEKRKPYIKSNSDERCINNDDGIADRAFILKVIEEQLEKQYVIPEEGIFCKRSKKITKF